MPRLIFKCPYIKGGSKKAKKHISNLVQYVATRDGVDMRKNYLDYISNRPGSHGLFSSSGEPIILSKVKRELVEHTGNIWLPIISLQAKDATRLGYDNANQWQALLTSYAYDLAEHFKIQPENFRWFAAFHAKDDHPHAHMMVFSTNPNEGYLTEHGIKKIKSGLAGRIFRQDLIQIYDEQTQQRDELKQKAQVVLREQISAVQSGVCNSPVVTEKLALLSERLKTVSGKKVYGYLKADIKAIVDDIVDEIGMDDRIARCYEAWYKMRDAVLETYSSNAAKRIPLSQQKEFRSIKNMVIVEALKLSDHNISLEQRNQIASPQILSATTRLLRAVGKIFDDQQQKLSVTHQQQIDHKRRRELKQKKQAQGHAHNDHEQS